MVPHPAGEDAITNKKTRLRTWALLHVKKNVPTGSGARAKRLVAVNLIDRLVFPSSPFVFQLVLERKQDKVGQDK
ncbi:hypothetical protein C350_00991 [Cryptococcus neoformans MW-RSA36]|nr:hypothetical protein C350_00991 [Cryptococcus neoformans var. grubii MW-RSA36]